MELSPEEKRKIYEEEKARLEAREQLEQERQRVSPAAGTGLEPNVAGLLCYLGGWITGIIFLILEPHNRWVRFHAAQSIVVFGGLTVAGIVLGWIPYAGIAFSTIIWIIGFILWIVLMVKAHNGERYKVPWAGDVAERMVGAVPSGDYPPPPPAAASGKAPPVAAPAAEDDLEKRIERKVEEFFRYRRGGRVTGSAVAIAWSIVLLVFFNFFYDYIAIYATGSAGGAGVLTRYPLLTGEYATWLPVLNATLIVAIAGHILLIIFDHYPLRELVRIVIGAMALATVIALLVIFPLDFSVIPDAMVAAGVKSGVIVVLILIAIGSGIGLLVRLIRLVVNLARGVTGYPGAG